MFNKNGEMYKVKTSFLPVLCALCLCGTNAMAASSVRVLGTNSVGGDKAVPVKTLGTKANTGGTVKKASVKSAGVGLKQQTVSAASTERAAVNVSTERIPAISVKNLQTGYKAINTNIGSVNNANTAGARIDDMSEQLDALQSDLDTKADITDLENYYTKPEIDEKFDSLDLGEISDRVTQNESDIENVNERVDVNDGKITIISDQITNINNRIDNIDTISSLQYMQEIQNRINGYELQLGQVVAASKKIYDTGTNKYKMVRLVDNFDPAVLNEDNN